MSRGFSLVETIVYIALLGFLMTGAVVSVFQIIQNSASLNSKNTVQEEGNFVLRKIDWALTGMSFAPSVTGSGTCSAELNTTLYTGGGTAVEIRRKPSDTKKIEIETNLIKNELTTDNVTVECLEFALLPGTPAGVTATVTIDGLNFAITKYARQ